MSYYKFTPAYSYQRGEHPFVTWQNGFSDSEINQLISIGESLPMIKATVGHGDGDDDKRIRSIRRSHTSWIAENQAPWLYEKLGYIIQQLNGQFYDYDLWGFHEDMQFTTYTAEDKGFYDWHQDSMGPSIDENNVDKRLPRKFSLTLQLSDPDEYKGGDLLIKTSQKPMVAPKAKGQIVAFPSFMLHKVAPVTKGVRKSLVVWVTGPAFK
jgi:PKHD-type hydroxylase